MRDCSISQPRGQIEMTGLTGRAIKRDKTRVKAKIDCMGQKTTGAVIDL